MDPSEMRDLQDDDTPVMKTIKGATSGFVAGTIFGTIVAPWYDVPRVERNVALPGLIRTLKMMGNYGATFAAIGGVYIGVEQLLQNYRMKRDFVNGAVGRFVAGATVLGYKGKSIKTAISAGSTLAVTVENNLVIQKIIKDNERLSRRTMKKTMNKTMKDTMKNGHEGHIEEES